MGSSTYLGGSSTISTGWTWSEKSGLSLPKKTKTSKKIERLNESINAWKKKKKINKSIHRKTGIDKYEGNIKDLALLNESRRRLIRKIYKSTNTKNIKLSEQENSRFIDEIKQKGSLDNWAKSQTQYNYEVKKIRKKKMQAIQK
jgi:hypothetical protein